MGTACIQIAGVLAYLSHGMNRAKPKAAPKEVRGRPHQERGVAGRTAKRAGGSAEERAPPARDEPPEPEPGKALRSFGR